MSGWIAAILWFLLAVVLAVVELFAPSFILIFISFAALVASFFALIGMPLMVQGIIFIISSILFLIFARPLVRHFVEKNKGPEPSCVYNIIGARAIVLKEVNQLNGKVKIMNTGEIWSAYTYEHFEPIKEDTQVIIKEVDGAKLIVVPKSAADMEKNSR